MFKLGLGALALAVCSTNRSLVLTSAMLVLPLTGSGLYEAYGMGWGISAIGALLALLSLWISGLVLVVGGSWNLTFFLLLFLGGAFFTANFFFFFIWFELTLIPIFFLILQGGYQPERFQASVYMLGYTIIGSLPLLWGILNLWGFEGSVYTQFFYGGAISQLPYYWSFLFVLGFMVKLPVYGVHMWLPKAHVEAPLGGSMLLAGLLLKLGGYGLYLILGAMDNIGVSLQVMHTWAMVGGCYAGLLCLTQTDLKSLIAYTSISHMAMVVGSLISGNVMGATTIMISHGFTSSALFVFAYTVYKFSGSRSILVSKGLLGCSLPLAMLLFLLAAFNLSVPPSLNFMGEVMASVSLVEWSWVSSLTIFGLIFLSGAYSLVMYSGLCHGSLSQVTLPGPMLNTRQVSVVVFHLVPSFLFILKLMMFN